MSLPSERGQRVLDIGCGVDDVAARLDARGLDVLAIDSKVEVIAAARARYPSVRFEEADIRNLESERAATFEGIWASFVTSYFPDLVPVLRRWRERLLRPGGWLAMVEVGDLLGHEPLSAPLRARIAQFYDEARKSGAL